MIKRAESGGAEEEGSMAFGIGYDVFFLSVCGAENLWRMEKGLTRRRIIRFLMRENLRWNIDGRLDLRQQQCTWACGLMNIFWKFW